MTDHKPLIYSLFCNPPRQAKHLEFISQFTSDVRNVHGIDNPVADALSRLDIQAIHHLPSAINFQNIAEAQQADAELQKLLHFLHYFLITKGNTSRRF